MENMKYVVIHNMFSESAIIFGSDINHNQFSGMNVISAGFIRFDKLEDDKIEVSVYGKSISLSLEHRPEDAEMICKTLNTNGFGKFVPQELIDPIVDFDIDFCNQTTIWCKGIPVCYFDHFEKWNNGVTEYAFDNGATPKQIDACLKLINKWQEEKGKKFKFDGGVLNRNNDAVRMKEKRSLAQKI